MTREEQKRVIVDAIMVIDDARLLDIISRLLHGILENDDREAAEIIKKAIRG